MDNNLNETNASKVNKAKSTQKSQTGDRWNNWGGRVEAEKESFESLGGQGEKEPLTGKKKWENFWFYYRKHVIVAVIVLVIVGVSIYESLHQEKYDVTVVLATNGTTITEQEELIADIFSQYAEDYNGDGKVNVYVDVQNLPLDNPEENSELFTAMQTRFAGELAVGEKSLYIMDQRLYDYYELAGTFNELSEQYSGIEGVDGDRFWLNELFADEPLLSEYMPECFIMQRDSQYMSGYKKDKIKAEYEIEKQFIDNVINGNILTPLEKTGEESSLGSEAAED